MTGSETVQYGIGYCIAVRENCFQQSKRLAGHAGEGLHSIAGKCGSNFNLSLYGKVYFISPYRIRGDMVVSDYFSNILHYVPKY